MRLNPRPALRVSAIISIFTTFAAIGCDKNPSPAQPSTSTAAVSAVTLSATSTPAGKTVDATVKLTAPAPAGGAGVVLSSTNAAVASVPQSVTVPAGSSSATFAVAAVAAGTAAITASFNGTG